MRTSWPNRKWVDTADGWASRETGFPDTRRRQHVESSLARGVSDEERAIHGEQIKRWADISENLDEAVRQQDLSKLKVSGG